MSATKNILIGVFVLLAFAIIIFILLFLHPSVGDNEKVLHVLFTDIDKINIGTRVTYAGLPVGEVVKIREVPEARTGRVNHQGEIYVYELTLRVDSTVQVFNSDTLYVRTSGLLGERNIEIDPHPPKEGEKLQEIEDELIYAQPTPTIEATLKKFGTLSDKFGHLLDSFSDTIEDFKDKKILDKVAKISDHMLDITSSLNQPDKWKAIIDNAWNVSEQMKETWPKVEASVQNIHSLTEKAQNSWTKVDRTVDEFYTASVNAHAFTADIQKIMAHAQQGKGTFGRLFMNDELYLRLKSIFHKGETTMGDVNQYGVLFHLNKRWQRANARRMNLLKRLSNPQLFADHFNREVDQLSDSLSQVSMVLDETSDYPQEMMNNPEYTQKYSELIRKVEEIEETLKMYNEQIVNQGALLGPSCEQPCR